MSRNEPAAPSPPRYHALDSLRACMMLLGVFLHASLPYCDLPLGKFKDPASEPVLDALVIFAHAFRMPVFFVMAGFFAALLCQRRGAAGLLRNRVVRVLVPLAAGWLLLTPLSRTGYRFARDVVETGSIAAGLGEVRAADFLKPHDVYHLWFLCDLLLFYAIVLGVRQASLALGPALRARISAGFRAVAASPWRALALALAAAVALLPAPLAPTGGLSPGQVLAMQAGPLLFFVFGWMLYAHADLVPGFGRRAWLHVGLALLLAPVSFHFEREYFGGARPGSEVHRLAAAGANAAIVSLMIFGLTGVFVRHLHRPIAAMRYLSDASYWLYLVHFPLVLWIGGLLVPVRLPASAKLGLLLAAAVPILLASYHGLVRFTFVGAVLNGRRVRRKPGAGAGLAEAASAG